MNADSKPSYKSEAAARREAAAAALARRKAAAAEARRKKSSRRHSTHNGNFRDHPLIVGAKPKATRQPFGAWNGGNNSASSSRRPAPASFSQPTNAPRPSAPPASRSAPRTPRTPTIPRSVPVYDNSFVVADETYTQLTKQVERVGPLERRIVKLELELERATAKGRQEGKREAEKAQQSRETTLQARFVGFKAQVGADVRAQIQAAKDDIRAERHREYQTFDFGQTAVSPNYMHQEVAALQSRLLAMEEDLAAMDEARQQAEEARQQAEEARRQAEEDAAAAEEALSNTLVFHEAEASRLRDEYKALKDASSVSPSITRPSPVPRLNIDEFIATLNEFIRHNPHAPGVELQRFLQQNRSRTRPMLESNTKLSFEYTQSTANPAPTRSVGPAETPTPASSTRTTTPPAPSNKAAARMARLNRINEASNADDEELDKEVHESEGVATAARLSLGKNKADQEKKAYKKQKIKNTNKQTDEDMDTHVTSLS